MMPTIIAISGPDGSGKSTFVAALESALSVKHSNLPIISLWLRWNPRPSRERAGQPVSTIDRRHRGHPAKRLARRVGARQLWVALACRNYRRQLQGQLAAVPANALVVADRYALDFCTDLIAAGVLQPWETQRVLDRLPRAAHTIVLTAPDEVLLSRADPHEDPFDAVTRAALFRHLAELTGASVVDTRHPDALARVLGAVSVG